MSKGISQEKAYNLAWYNEQQYGYTTLRMEYSGDVEI